VQVVAEESHVQSRVQQLLGITVEHLARVVQAAAGGRNSATRFHPSSTPGSNMYSEGTAALRRELMGEPGWNFDEANQQPRTFNSDRRITVIVQSGDEMTGIDGPRAPRSKHGKGEATRLKVDVNTQLRLFDVKASDEIASDLALHTWVLLMAESEGELRAELSRPTGMDSAGHLSDWTERILLPATPLGGDLDFELDREEDDDQGDGFDVTWQS
jgi:hypothetical protein